MRKKLPLILLAALLAGCGSRGGSGELTVGVAFETLQTEYWVASRNAIEAELKKHNARMLEAIADGDANRQYEQIRNFITRRVDGIIAVPKDAQTIIPMIREANKANISLRTGCFCNPGAGEIALGISRVELDVCFAQPGHEERLSIDDFRHCIDGKSSGAVRISVGMVTNFEDAQAFLSFAKGLLS